MTDRSNTDDTPVNRFTSDGEQLEKLRQLLGVADADGVRHILNRLDDPDLRARDLSGVLPDAVMLSARADDRLGDALEPSVQRAVHTAIQHDPDPFAHALYPALAPAIRRAIAETLRGMVQSLNELVQHSFSLKGLRWRLEAFKTRRPFAEVVLSHSLIYRVEQAFLIHRETGLLLQHVVDPAIEVQDPDLVSSMLTAIQDFVHDSFVVGDDAGLQEFRVGDLTVWIERGRDAVLAVAIRGAAPESLRESLRGLLRAISLSHFVELETFDGDVSAFDSARDDMMSCLVRNFRKPSAKPSFMLWLILVVFLAALGFWVVVGVGEHRRWTSFLGSLESEPGIVVTTSKTSDGGRQVNGLRDPLSVDPRALARDSGYANDEVEFHFEAFTSLDSELVLKRSTRDLDPPGDVNLRLENGVLVADGIASGRWIETSRARAPSIPGIEVFRFVGHRADPSPELLSIAGRVEGHLVRFPSFSDEPLVEDLAVVEGLARDLGELASVGLDNGWTTRISLVGHADSTGGEEINLDLSLRRAEAVRSALVERGVDPDILIVAGAGSSRPLSEEIEAPSGGDRRVMAEVELVATSRDDRE